VVSGGESHAATLGKTTFSSMVNFSAQRERAATMMGRGKDRHVWQWVIVSGRRLHDGGRINYRAYFDFFNGCAKPGEW